MSQNFNYLGQIDVSMRRRKREALMEPCLTSTVKHGGGNIQVWGCISIKGVGDIVRKQKKLTGEKYKYILQNHAVSSGRQLIGDNFILQQENDPKHTCKLVKKYLSNLEGSASNHALAPSEPRFEHNQTCLQLLRQKEGGKVQRNLNELWNIL